MKEEKPTSKYLTPRMISNHPDEWQNFYYDLCQLAEDMQQRHIENFWELPNRFRLIAALRNIPVN